MNVETEEVKAITEGIGIDDKGAVFIKGKDGEWDSVKDIDMRIEKFTEDNVLKAFPDSLLNEGDQVYVRKSGGRLQWMKANVRGGGEKWQELTPVTAKAIEANGGVRPLTHKEKSRKFQEGATLSPEMLTELTKPETHQIGWYQDAKGDLYQFNGTEWVGTVPTKKLIEELEFLG